MEYYFVSIDKNNKVISSRSITYFSEPTSKQLEIDASGDIQVAENPEKYLNMKYDADSNKFLETKHSAIEKRNRKLIDDVDPIVTNILKWNDLSKSKQNEWSVYRKKLLDLPSQHSFPENIEWPVKPE